MAEDSYQGACVIAHERPVVVDLPLQDDEQEEQAQQHVAQVADDVVEGAAGGVQPVSALGPTPTALPRARTPTLSPEVPQRVGTQEVVVADVLVAGDVHHLQV